MTERLGEGHPIIRRMAGMTYRLHVTRADTGLPGNPKNSLFFPPMDSVANVVGFL